MASTQSVQCVRVIGCGNSESANPFDTVRQEEDRNGRRTLQGKPVNSYVKIERY